MGRGGVGLGGWGGGANPVTTHPKLTQPEIFHKHGYRGEHIILYNFLILKEKCIIHRYKYLVNFVNIS